MYDQHMRWIEQDDEEHERPRCPKGHFLPNFTEIAIDAGELGRGVFPVERIQDFPPGTSIEPYWRCKCGAIRQGE